MKKLLVIGLVLFFSLNAFSADHTKSMKHKHKKKYAQEYVKVDQKDSNNADDDEDKGETHGASANFLLW